MTDAMFHKPRPQTDSSKTVTLSERDVRAAARVLSLLVGTPSLFGDEDERPEQGTRSQASRSELLAAASKTFLNRRRRCQHFGQGMFGEPAWDMLIALYIMEPSSARNTVGRLLTYSGVPSSTALRWLDYLEIHQLASREAHPTDRRTAFVEITDKGRQALDAYFSGTLAAEG